MSEVTFKVGDVIQSTKLRQIPAGSKVINASTLEIKTRSSDTRWFEEGGTGYGNDDWVVLMVAEIPPPKPDLSNRDALAQELYRNRSNTQNELPQMWRESYERMADFVLANFIPLPAEVQDGEYDHWYLAKDGKYSQYRNRDEGVESLHELAETYGGYTVQ